MSDLKRKIQKSLQSHTLLTDMFGYGLTKLGFADKYLAGLVTMYHSYHWLEKKFGPLADKLAEADRGETNVTKGERAPSRRVWACWFQGMDKAPKIVQDCLASIEYWLSDWDITVITAENYAQYADIPKYVVDKWKRGIICDAHFSDILRLSLLIRHGGLWLDATTFLSGPLPEYILNTDFFVYRNGWLDYEMVNMGNWLIWSRQPNNTLLRETLLLLLTYWREFDYPRNYFVLHMFFRMVSDRHPKEWAMVPYRSQIDSHLLQRELEEPFDQDVVREITDATSVHKLTYKLYSRLDVDATACHLSGLNR